MSKLGKTQIIAKLAEKTDKTKSEAGDNLNAVLSVISEALEAGESISLVGFGSLTVKERAARVGRNPQNGEVMNIPASKNVAFKASSSLKKAL